MTTATRSEIYCGAVRQLPRDAFPTAPELFAQPSLRIDTTTRFKIAVVEAYGLIDQAGWAMLAIRLHEASKAADALVLRISSRAQQARGVAVAFSALEYVAQTMSTTAVVESAGAGGAALALAHRADTVVAADDRTPTGWMEAAALYGDGTADADADDVNLLLMAMIGRRNTTSVSGILAELVRYERLTFERAQRVLNLLSDVQGI
jgi:hypothetical protein